MPNIVRLNPILYSIFRDGVADENESQVYLPDIFKLNELEFKPDKYAKMRVAHLMQDDNLVKVKDLRDFFKAYLMEDDIFFAAVNADREAERTLYTLNFTLSRKLLNIANDLNQSLVEQDKRLDSLEGKVSDLKWSAVAKELAESDEHLEARTKAVLAWIQRKKVQVFSKRDAFRALQGNRLFKKSSALDTPLQELEEHGYIRRMQAPGRSGRPSEKYQVNPYALQ